MAAAFSLLVQAVALTAPVVSPGTPESKPMTGMFLEAHSSRISVTASVDRAARAIAFGFLAISVLTMLTCASISVSEAGPSK